MLRCKREHTYSVASRGQDGGTETLERLWRRKVANARRATANLDEFVAKLEQRRTLLAAEGADLEVGAQCEGGGEPVRLH